MKLLDNGYLYDFFKSYNFFNSFINISIIAGFISAEEAEHHLKKRDPNTFLLRFSKSEISSFALAYVSKDRVVKHTLLKTLYPHTVTMGSKSYSSIFDFLEKNNNRLQYGANYCWLGSLDDKKQKMEEEMASDSVYKPPVHECDSSEKISSNCIICMDAPQETLFLECGHMCCCKACSNKLNGECPVCRQVITRIVPVFQTK